ncbi:hypothetical protein VN12_23380 [Pirellula sp. SH-Sr6A]|nr:hypothetical protein VN12_23380 [Pirellula sp. SH-Sr6A]
MVSMSSVHTILIEDARQTLTREIATVAGRSDLHEAFVAWLCPNAIPGVSIERAVSDAVNVAGAERSFAHVAVLGLAAQVRALSPQEREALVAGLNVTINREPVVAGTPMGFCMNGVALGSLVLGAKATGDDAIWKNTCNWLRKCREATAEGLGLESWQDWLLDCIAKQTAASWNRRCVDCQEAAAVRVALSSRGIGAISSEDEQLVLDFVRSSSITGIGNARAAIRLAALDWIKRERPTCDIHAVNATDVAEVLRRIPSGLKKWTWESNPRTRTAPAARQWHIENEYHVQNMLWLVLAPLHPNLVDEDSTPKVGPVQPRADIGLPSLRLIVEAKFMRSSDPPKKMVEQIAQDASLYLVPGSKYDKLISFIWDDSRRTEYHEEMIQGLRQISGVADAIIVSKPGSMVTFEACESNINTGEISDKSA